MSCCDGKYSVLLLLLINWLGSKYLVKNTDWISLGFDGRLEARVSYICTCINVATIKVRSLAPSCSLLRRGSIHKEVLMADRS